MTFKNMGISKKIGLLVVVMGISSLIIAAISGSGLYGLQKAMTSVGAREEVAREAMDLRVDIIAISRMTYQLAAAPEKAADFRAETEKRAAEMLGRIPKIQATADATETEQLKTIKAALDSYFNDIRAMVTVAEQTPGDAAAMSAALGKALAGQKVVTDTVKVYSTYSGNALAEARANALSSSTMAMIVAAVSALAFILIGAAISTIVARKGIVLPIRSLTQAMSRLAQGDMEGGGIDSTRKDEIGEMARAVEVFRNNALAMRSSSPRKPPSTSAAVTCSPASPPSSHPPSRAISPAASPRTTATRTSTGLPRASTNWLAASIAPLPKSAASSPHWPTPT